MSTPSPSIPHDPIAPAVAVEDLRVSFDGGHRRVDAVRGISLRVGRGRSVAIVGESGSGKSVTARSLVGLVGGRSSVSSSRFTIDGLDATHLTDRQWQRIRGQQIGFVLQDALGSLDPFRRVGQEVAEPLLAHDLVPREEVDAKVAGLLSSVGVPDPELRQAQYPHQLSGGLRQRALIASAIAADPTLLIADEPTTALDVTVQAQILALLEERRAAGTALLLVSHDLAVVSRLAEHVYVMKDGEVVEEGATEEVLGDPQHPYTRRLLDAVPTARTRGRWLSSERRGETVTRPPVGEAVVLEAHGLRKEFDVPGDRRLVAVDDVSLTLHAGETLGIVGESGSGKSTLGRLLLGLETPDAGQVEVHGDDWTRLPEREVRRRRRHAQVVWQDPLGSFDPRYTVSRILAEPLQAVGEGTRAERRARVVELLEQVGLDADVADRRPRQLSGGQRQRVAIARALAARPDVIVCDEAVSALDVSIQAQVLDLLADLQARLGVAYVFISHHLGVVHHVSDRVLVMKDGVVVESGSADAVLQDPQHPYTRELVASIPALPTSTRRSLAEVGS